MIFSYTITPFSYCITNTVACRPTTTGPYGQIENREPTAAEIAACKPRLDQLLAKQRFDGLVYIGKIARSYTTKNHISVPNLFSRAHNMTHPASIARMEYKLFDIKEQALKLERYVNSQTQTRTNNLHRK